MSSFCVEEITLSSIHAPFRFSVSGSLGKYFRNDINSFSQNPYLKSIENYKDLELENILNKAQEFKIGISWKSFKNRCFL